MTNPILPVQARGLRVIFDSSLFLSDLTFNLSGNLLLKYTWNPKLSHHLLLNTIISCLNFYNNLLTLLLPCSPTFLTQQPEWGCWTLSHVMFLLCSELCRDFFQSKSFQFSTRLYITRPSLWPQYVLLCTFAPLAHWPSLVYVMERSSTNNSLSSIKSWSNQSFSKRPILSTLLNTATCPFSPLRTLQIPSILFF